MRSTPALPDSTGGPAPLSGLPAGEAAHGHPVHAGDGRARCARPFPLPAAQLLRGGQHNVPRSRCATRNTHPDTQSCFPAAVYRLLFGHGTLTTTTSEEGALYLLAVHTLDFLLVAVSRWTPSRTSSTSSAVVPSTPCAIPTTLTDLARPARPMAAGAIARRILRLTRSSCRT